MLHMQEPACWCSSAQVSPNYTKVVKGEGMPSTREKGVKAVVQSPSSSKKEYIHTYIHIYTYTYKYIYIYICVRAGVAVQGDLIITFDIVYPKSLSEEQKALACTVHQACP